jgi:hypothetical protein
MIENQQTTSYKQRLETHINHYLRLVTDYPSVRYHEFNSLVRYADLANPKQIIEVPAEGQILERFYPDAMITRADLVPVKGTKEAAYTLTDWSLSNIKSSYYDAVLALAPLHHATASQKKHYIEGAYTCLKNEGVIAFGEVENASKLSVFLDQFVNEHTYTSHHGEYPETSFMQVMEEAQFKEVTSDRLNCNWIFDSQTQMLDYMTQLFELKPIQEKLFLKALSDILGFKHVGEKIHLNWELLFFRGVK